MVVSDSVGKKFYFQLPSSTSRVQCESQELESAFYSVSLIGSFPGHSGLTLNQLNFCNLELVTGSLKEWLEMRVSPHHYTKGFLCCLFGSSFQKVAVKHNGVIPFETWKKWKESAFKYSIPRNVSVAYTQAWSSNRAQSVLDFRRVTFTCIVGLGLKWNLKCVGPLGPVRGLKDRFAFRNLSIFILFWWETKDCC